MCCLLYKVLLSSLKNFDNANSIAPPPATTLGNFLTRLAIIIASCNDLWVSDIYCSAPPRNTIVAVFLCGQFLNKLYRSLPSCLSSNSAQVPKILSVNLLQVDWTTAPVAFESLIKSSSLTLPAQNISLSANYCVARSPIGNFEQIIFAPVFVQFPNFSYIIVHSASTIDW